MTTESILKRPIDQRHRLSCSQNSLCFTSPIQREGTLQERDRALFAKPAHEDAVSDKNFLCWLRYVIVSDLCCLQAALWRQLGLNVWQDFALTETILLRTICSY